MNKVATTSQGLKTVGDLMVSQQDKIAKALAAANSDIEADDWITVALDVFRANPDLLKCSQQSLWLCMHKCASSGLKLGGAIPEAYIVPFGGKGGHHATLIYGYRGYLTMVRRSGEVASIAADVVREGDEYEYSDDPLQPMLRHRRSTSADRHNATPTHAYCAFLLKNGERIYFSMTWEECMAIGRQFSKSFANKDSMWKTAPEQAAKKTVIRRAVNSGLVPVSERLKKAVAMEGENVIDATAITVPLEQLTDQTPAEPDQTPSEPEEQAADVEPKPNVDISWYKQELKKLTTPLSVDRFRNQCLEEYAEEDATEMYELGEEWKDYVASAPTDSEVV